MIRRVRKSPDDRTSAARARALPPVIPRGTSRKPKRVRADLSGKRPDSNGLLAGAQTARVLNLTIGQDVAINGRPMPVVGILGATGSQDDDLLFTALSTAQAILGKQGQISLVEVAALCNACPVDEMVQQISGVLPDAKVMAIQQVVKGRMDTLHRFSTFSLGMSAVVILVGSLVVLTTMMSSVRERKEEIGIFRAMGFRKSHIMGIIFSEAAMISGPAGLIGYLAGTGATFLAVRFFSGLEHASVVWDPALCGGAILMAMVVGLMASVYPAIMAARLDPNTALRSL